jgi:iron-sulfur cluster repair protein YtfE (RIC family)
MKTILEFMELEHRRLVDEWRGFLAEKDRKKSKELLKKFSDNLLRHIHLEDGALSPTFNDYLKIEKGTGPTAVLNGEHVNIIRMLDKVKVAHDTGNEREFAYESTHFERALVSHQDREEETHYVLFDKVISQKEWEEWEEVLNGKA